MGHSYVGVLWRSSSSSSSSSSRAIAPGWSVAVSTSFLHRSLSWASRHAELSPWLNGWRSAFRVRSQVWCGRALDVLAAKYWAELCGPLLISVEWSRSAQFGEQRAAYLWPEPTEDEQILCQDRRAGSSVAKKYGETSNNHWRRNHWYSSWDLSAERKSSILEEIRS